MTGTEARIAAQIEKARRRREYRRRQREELSRARAYGLTSRHAAKMRRWGRLTDGGGQ